MPNWDIFHSDRLEVERNLPTAAVRAGIASGAIAEDDLARVSGSGEPWTSLADHPELASAFGGGPANLPTLPGPTDLRAMIDDEDDAAEDDRPAARPVTLDPELERGESLPQPPRPSPAATPPTPAGVRKATTEDLDPVGFPDDYDRDLDLSLRDPRHVVNLDGGEDEEEYDPEAEDEDAAEFTLARGGAETVEELDLAAMVDVAFQLVLFFLVTASTVIFKTLEVPKPNPDQKKSASATQGSGRTMEDLQNDYILVEIDPNGAVKIDHENGPNDFNGLSSKLRELRQSSGRLSMLLTADSATLHKHAVMAYDAANEVGLKIAISQPAKAPAAAGAPAPATPAPAPAK